MSEPINTNLVICGNLSQTINISNFFKLVPVTPIVYKNSSENKSILNINLLPARCKIPYYGVENAIISARYGSIYKGFRGPSKVKAFGDIDVQFDNKNVHIKISNNTINIIGVISEEMGNKAFQVLIAHFHMVNQQWKYIFNSKHKESTLNWLMENLYRKTPPLNYEIIPEIVPDDVDRYLAILLALHATTEPSVEMFEYKIKQIFECNTPIFDDTKELVILDQDVKNNVFSYNLKRELNLYETAIAINEFKNYKVSYHNIKAEYMSIVLPVNWSKYEDYFENTSNKSENFYFKKLNLETSTMANHPVLDTLIYLDPEDKIEVLNIQTQNINGSAVLKYVYYDDDIDIYGLVVDENDQIIFINENHSWSAPNNTIYDQYLNDCKKLLDFSEEDMLKDEDFIRLFNDKNKDKAHRFIIRSSGAVTQTSPTNRKEAIAAYNKLLQDLK